MKKNELENLLKKATAHIELMQKDSDKKSLHIGLLANLLIANMLTFEQTEITYSEKEELPYEINFNRDGHTISAKIRKV